MKKNRFFPILAAAALTLSAAAGCGRKGYDDFSFPEQGPSTLRPLSDIYIDNHYEGTAPTKEKTVKTVKSDDGLCVIECKDSYFDVTLDYEKGTPQQVGAAYGKTILLAYPDYSEMCEGYLYENIKAAFSHLNGDYSGIKKRTDAFYSALPENYRQELDGFAGAISGDSEGFTEDGIISCDEAKLLQFIPDVLRNTACSALSANGNATASGERITARLLEWQLGTENQICKAHTLVHMKNGEKSFTSLSYLGFLTILTAVNDDGVMLGELDVGSGYMVKYTCENKTSYTYGIRYALENFTTARDAAEYLTENAYSYPYSVNVLATDKNEALVAELFTVRDDQKPEPSNEPDEEEIKIIGTPLIRDSSSELHRQYTWEDSNYICAVNCFVTTQNLMDIDQAENNLIRWQRYKDLFCGKKDITLDRFKELMTCENTDNDLDRIRSDGLVHMFIADYSTETMQAVLTGADGVEDSPEFIDLGSWK